LGILLSIGSKEKTAVKLASEVISENGDLFGLYNISIHERNHEEV
jgi:DNA repair protein RadC